MTIPRIEPTTNVSSAAVARVFRFDGRLHVAVIAKTRLLLVPGQPLRMRAPPPVGVSDGSGPAGREDAPFLPLTDVTFTGTVHLERGKPTPRTIARIAVLRPREIGGRMEQAETLLNKTLCAFEVERFGPTPVEDRRRVLASELRARVEAPVPELWTTMDYDYFHAAPNDQRTSHLRGDEWLWLERLHPASERFACQLPLLRAVGEIQLANQNKPFLMRIDTLRIDGENAWCDVLARGSFAIGSLEDVSRIGVIAGFEASHPKAREATMILEPARPPVAQRRDKTMLLEPAPKAPGAEAPAWSEEATHELAPVTVMPSALDARPASEQSVPATRAPFQLAKPGQSTSTPGEIPGAPWAVGDAPKVTPARAAKQRTLDPDDRTTVLELQRRLAGQPPSAPSLKTAAVDIEDPETLVTEPKPSSRKPVSRARPSARKVQDVWRKPLPEETLAPAAPAPQPPPRIGATSDAAKKALYNRFRKR